MATTVLTNAIEVSLAGLTNDTWGNVTLPVPEGTQWAMLKHINTTSGAFSFGSRPVGSTDAAYKNMRGNSQNINFVKVDANRQVNVRVQDKTLGRLYLLGYSEAATFRTDHSGKTPVADGTWQLYDLTADKPGSFTAAGMFCRIHSGGYYSGLRADGSSDVHLFSFASDYWVGAFTGVDEAEEIRCYGSAEAASSYRVTGLFDAAEWEFLTNWEQLSVAAGDTGRWYAASTNRPGIRAALVFIRNTADSVRGGCVRGAGSSDLHNTHGLIAADGAQFGIAACDELGRIEVWKETDAVLFYLAGWLKGGVEKAGHDFACALDSGGLTRATGQNEDGAALSESALAVGVREAATTAYLAGFDWGVLQQPAFLAACGAASGQQGACARGGEPVVTVQGAFAQGAQGLPAAQSAFLGGEALSGAVTALAFVAAHEGLTLSGPAFAAGLEALGGTTLAYLSGSSGLSAGGQQPGWLCGLGQVGGLCRACLVAGLNAGQLSFRLGDEQLVFSCGRLYPLRAPRERLQVVLRTAGGSLRVQDKGTLKRQIKLAFRGLAAADHAALARWYEEVAVGALNAFSFADEHGAERQVRWLGAFEFEETAAGRFAGAIELEEV